MFEKIKDAILSKVLSSLLPKYAARYEREIRNIAMAINALLVAFNAAIPLLPDGEMEERAYRNLDYIRDYYNDVLRYLKDYAGLDLRDYF